MKKVILLLLLSSPLFGKNMVDTIPLHLQQQLCTQLAQNSNRCENGSTLDYYKHFVLKNDQLLLFVYLNEHVLSYGQTNNTIPLQIDNLGHWTLSQGENTISEDIESIHQDQHNNIWVRAMWHSEGVYPALYHSADAISWKRTLLPKNRGVDCCFESIDPPLFQKAET